MSVTEPRRPTSTSRLQGFGTTIFAEMSALAVATGSINLGQGFPDTDGPRRGARRRHRRDPRRPQPVPARASASPSCAHAIAAHQQQLVRPRLRRRHRGARHRGRDRGDRGRAARAVRAGRRGRHVRAVLRLVRRVHRDGRARTRRVVHAAHARLRVRPRRARSAAITPRTRLLLLNSPHNPTGKVFSPRRARARSPSSCMEHDLLVVTDEVYEHLVFDGEHVPLATLPGHARPHGHDLVGRQDVLVHRLEGRLGLRAARRSSTAVKTAKQFLTYVNGGPFQYGDRGRARAARTRTSAGSPPTLRREARPAVAPGSADAGFAVFRPPGTYFVTADIRRSARPTASRSAGRCPSGAAWSRSRASCSTTTRTPGAPLVRFAFCKRLEVHRRSRAPAEGAGADEGRRASSTTSCGRTATRTSRASRR